VPHPDQCFDLLRRAEESALPSPQSMRARP
jgi:hypothetical protein